MARKTDQEDPTVPLVIDMSGGATIFPEVPSSLWEAFDAYAKGQGISMNTAAGRLMDGLVGLADSDLWSWEESPGESLSRTLFLSIGPERVVEMERLCYSSGLSCSAIFNRTLHAFVILNQIEGSKPQDHISPFELQREKISKKRENNWKDKRSFCQQTARADKT